MEDKATSMPMVVELFGHNKIAGMVSEQNFGGTNFIRVDVPETAVSGPFTRMFHANAIYCLNPVTEDVMLNMAAKYTQLPITPFDIRVAANKMLEATSNVEDTPGGKYSDEEGEERW